MLNCVFLHSLPAILFSRGHPHPAIKSHYFGHSTVFCSLIIISAWTFSLFFICWYLILYLGFYLTLSLILSLLLVLLFICCIRTIHWIDTEGPDFTPECLRLSPGSWYLSVSGWTLVRGQIFALLFVWIRMWLTFKLSALVFLRSYWLLLNSWCWESATESTSNRMSDNYSTMLG